MGTAKSLTMKQQRVQRAFARFAERLGKREEWISFASRPEPEPDLLCIHAMDGAIAFEMVSLTGPKIAQLQAAPAKVLQGASYTTDRSSRIIMKELHRHYESSAGRIELLVYIDGQIVTPDDAILPTIAPWLDAIEYQFRRIWFMGEVQTCCV